MDTAPCDGRYPRIPQNDAGILTQPVVSVAARMIRLNESQIIKWDALFCDLRFEKQIAFQMEHPYPLYI